MKHAEGPWIGKEQNNGQGLVYSERDGSNIAVCYDKVNVHLIASAPEQYKANLDNVKALEGYASWDGQTSVERELIAAIQIAVDRSNTVIAMVDRREDEGR